MSLVSPQHLGLAGAGAAWSSAEDPAVRARLDRPQLQLTAGQDQMSRRSPGAHAWLPWGPGRNVGLALGLGPDAQGDAEGRLRLALGQRLLGPQSPSLGLALTWRERLSTRDRGMGLGFDLGLAWVLPWQRLELGAALRELPVTGAPGAWRREGALGAGWRRDGLHLAADLTQAVDEALMLNLGAEQRLDSTWHVQAGVASPSFSQGLWTWGLGLRRRLGDFWWTVATRQHCGDGPAAVKVGLGWDLRPVPLAQGPKRASTAQIQAPPPARPKPDAGSFVLTAQRSNGSLRLSWPEQPQVGGYEVMMALVPGASMRQAPEGLVRRAAWQGELGLPGVTYYFKVRVLDADGSQVAESWVLAVTPEEGGP